MSPDLPRDLARDPSYETPRARREPRATYRVQLHAGFDFAAAAGLADYLAALGVSHLYCSPYLQAAPGSTHGYDVVDPHRLNEELGSAAGHARLVEALAAAGLGQILDIVPNHMAISGRESAWWWDVLENGPSSRYARYFDVDWDAPEGRARDRVLVPILGDHYGRVLAKGAITLAYDDGGFTLSYYEHILPVAPRSLDTLLAAAARTFASDELAFLAGAFANLPPATVRDAEQVQRRHRDKEVLRGLLADLCRRDAYVTRAIGAVVAEINADPQRLDELLERQHYRLTYWRAAERELDYRRFFDINSLVGLRNEDEDVFLDTHALILRWLSDGILDGVRVDHVDGLRDPAAYLERLRERAPNAWVVVEKILEPGEHLPAAWPVAGTTGYDFLNRATGLFVDPAAEVPLTSFYAEFTGQPTDYHAMLREKKLLILRESLGSDISRLSALWYEACQRHWRYRDYTRRELHDVLLEVIAAFPIYRTYARAAEGSISAEDARVIAETLEAARARRPDLDGDLFALLGDLLTLRLRGELESELVMRFQQLTGPAMAKGAEDTAFYVYTRLVALNEVGGDLGRFGCSLDEFHAACVSARERWPQAMLASSTHDTKRSEDVRARLALLSELPDRWCETVRRWSAHNERHRRDVGNQRFPDRDAEYLYYQTLVGAWPLTTERAVAYMEKAAHEAKLATSWTQPDPAYDEALHAFVESTLADDEFRADLEAFIAPLVTPGWITGLAQTLLKLAAPGVPDIYQGTELWDLSLVDPDNRRPVDYGLRRRLLAELEGLSPEAIWERRAEGLPKLWLIRQALALRARRSEAFAGAYAPLPVRGARAAHVVALLRGGAVAAVAPRLVLGLGGERPDWADTTLALPPGRWRDELTGETREISEAGDGGMVALADLLRRFPVALLVREGEPA